MKELIKITQQPNSAIPTVNARDLWEKLQVKTHFRDWVKRRIERSLFVENKDYVISLKNGRNSGAGRPREEYHVSIDMAKHLAMQENSEIGFAVRNYFIQCEQIAQEEAPQSYAEALRQLADTIDQKQALANQITKEAPLVKFSKEIKESSDAITVGDFAKILSKRGFRTGQKRLFQALYDMNLLMNAQTPYQTAIERGWFEVKEYPFRCKEGRPRIATQVLITGKGQLAIWKKLQNLK